MKSFKNVGLAAFSSVLLGVLFFVFPADAGEGLLAPDSFRSALATAWSSNPEIRIARHALALAQEDMAVAWSYYGPTASAGASVLSQHNDPEDFGSASGETKLLSLEVTQPLYRGGRTVSSIKSARAGILAAEARLLQAEQSVLLAAVTAYMDVFRDTELVALRIDDENVLAKQRDAANVRFRLGDISKTDVSQAEAHLAEAKAARIKAEGTLKGSQALFEKVTGMPWTGKPELPVLGVSLPATLDEALVRADSDNPDIIAAAHLNESDRHNIRTLFGEILPAVDLVGSASRTYNPAFGNLDEQDNASLTVQAKIPLFSSGRAAARIRQARETENQSRVKIEDVRRIVRQGTIEAWEERLSAQAEAEARVAQVTAAKLAFEGTDQEARLGGRSMLDVLDAEHDLMDAQTALVAANRDATVSFFRLLSFLGGLNGKALGLEVGAIPGNDSNYENKK